MTVEDLIILGKKILHKDKVMMLLGSILGYNSLELLLHLEDQVNDSTIDEYKKKIMLLKENKPIAANFFNVN